MNAALSEPNRALRAQIARATLDDPEVFKKYACALCSKATTSCHPSRAPANHPELFHEPCDICDTLPNTSRLCSLCRHLRLRHLVSCMRWGKHAYYLMYNVNPFISSESKACEFCELSRSVISAGRGGDPSGTEQGYTLNIYGSRIDVRQMNANYAKGEATIGHVFVDSLGSKCRVQRGLSYSCTLIRSTSASCRRNILSTMAFIDDEGLHRDS